MSDEKVVDYTTFNATGEKVLTLEDMIRESGQLAAELIKTYPPVTCLVLLKITKKYVDYLIEVESGMPDMVEMMNQVADQLANQATIKAVEPKGSG